METKTYQLKKVTKILMKTLSLGEDPAHEALVSSLGDRYEMLRAWRNELAAAKDIRPYLILTNLDLLEIASAFPKSLEALADIPGIGPKKLVEYGDAVLAVLLAPPMKATTVPTAFAENLCVPERGEVGQAVAP